VWCRDVLDKDIKQTSKRSRYPLRSCVWVDFVTPTILAQRSPVLGAIEIQIQCRVLVQSAPCPLHSGKGKITMQNRIHLVGAGFPKRSRQVVAPRQETTTGAAGASEPLCIAQGAAANVPKFPRRHPRHHKHPVPPQHTPTSYIRRLLHL
jgi:hypothetical protein